VSARGDEAAATLARLGLDHEAVRAGRVGADAVAPLLAGADGAALAVALGELPSPEVAALLVALEPRAGERAVRKEIRRALYRLRQRGVPVPEPPAPAAAAGPTDRELHSLRPNSAASDATTCWGTMSGPPSLISTSRPASLKYPLSSAA